MYVVSHFMKIAMVTHNIIFFRPKENSSQEINQEDQG